LTKTERTALNFKYSLNYGEYRKNKKKLLQSFIDF
jgi:hypothetical protein